MNEPASGRPSTARRSVVRSAAFYTPLFIIAFATLLAMANDRARGGGGGGGGILLIVIVALVALLLGFQSIQALRDLRAGLVETRGKMGRRWSRSNLLLWRSYYVQVNGAIFTVGRLDYELLQSGDEVAVRHLPNTGTVESIDRVPASPPARADAADAPAAGQDAV